MRADYNPTEHLMIREFGFIAFNATFNNISVLSWRSDLLVEETGVPGKKQGPVASHWQTLSHNDYAISSTPRHERDSNSQLPHDHDVYSLHIWSFTIVIIKWLILTQSLFPDDSWPKSDWTVVFPLFLPQLRQSNRIVVKWKWFKSWLKLLKRSKDITGKSRVWAVLYRGVQDKEISHRQKQELLYLKSEKRKSHIAKNGNGSVSKVRKNISLTSHYCSNGGLFFLSLVYSFVLAYMNFNL